MVTQCRWMMYMLENAYTLENSGKISSSRTRRPKTVVLTDFYENSQTLGSCRAHLRST